jgi:hypothetical protein
MFGTYFYHEHIKRTVAVFGTLFNNLKVVKRDTNGKIISTIKVPLSYGPRQKFLARIADEKYLNDPKLAIRLPRMSFEIVSLTYDTSSKLQKGMTKKIPVSNESGADTFQRSSVLYPISYRIGLQLNILAKNQDDALQILEQILPYFQPDYTVTIKEVNNNFKSDVPFVIQAVTMSDDYEGDFMSRRSIIYSIEFEAKVKFYGPLTGRSITKDVRINISDTEMASAGVPYSASRFKVFPIGAAENEEHEIITTYSAFDNAETATLNYTTITGMFEVGDIINGITSGAAGKVSGIGTGFITVSSPDENFTVGETVTNSEGTASIVISTIDLSYHILE